MSNCKSCNAEIIWITTEKGKPQPLDAKPEKRIILENRHYGTERGVQSELIGKVVDTYMPHHATCPDADKFRKKK